MKFYLRVINPVISLIVFLICFWASITYSSEDGSMQFSDFVVGGISSYFFAKGIYTSISLFLMGRILLEILNYTDNQVSNVNKKLEITYSIIFALILITSLVGLYSIRLNVENKEAKAKPLYSREINAHGLVISNVYRIPESNVLKYSGLLTNETDSAFNSVLINSKLKIDGKLSDMVSNLNVGKLEGKSKTNFIMNFPDFSNANVPDSAEIEFTIESN